MADVDKPAVVAPVADEAPSRFLVAGVGASAGGLEALEELIRNAPAARVAPDHESLALNSDLAVVRGVFSSSQVFRDHQAQLQFPGGTRPVRLGGSLVPASTEAPVALVSIKPAGEVPGERAP